jgi:hypothetical protein
LERIEDILQRQYRGTPVERALDAGRLAAAWPTIVGEPWGSEAWPLRLQNGVLWLGVADSSWAQRLAFDVHRLSRKVTAYLGYTVEIRAKVRTREQRQAEPMRRDAPLENDPRVLHAVRGMPTAALRSLFRNYLGRVAAYQQFNRPIGEKHDEME